MIGIEWGSGTVRCSFCGKRGHNVSSCNHVEEVFQTIAKNNQDTTSLTLTQRRAIYEMKNRADRKQKRKNRKNVKKSSRCSFCREAGHRRTTCTKHKSFRKKIYRANQIWKKEFVELVNETGIGIGSLIEFPRASIMWYAADDDKLRGIVTAFNMDSLNIFSAWPNQDKYRTVPNMVVVDCADYKQVNWPFNKIQPFVDNGLTLSRWGNVTTDIVCSAPWQPPTGWLESKENSEIEYVLSSLSREHKAYAAIDTLVKNWLNRDNK